jgi:hypothetical protein
LFVLLLDLLSFSSSSPSICGKIEMRRGKEEDVRTKRKIKEWRR